MFNLLIIPLGAFLSSYVGYLAARALMGLGMGVISYGAISIALELLYAQAQGYYNNIPSFVLQIIGLAGREKANIAHAEQLEHAGKLVFHNIGKAANNQQMCRRVGSGFWQNRHHAGQASIFALSKRGFDSAAGIIENPNLG